MFKKNKLNIKDNIISQIKTGKVKMKPKWYFVSGSIIMFLGLINLSIVAIFLINLSIFLLKRNGPLLPFKLQMIFLIFPWWIPVFAIVGIFLAVWLLKKYDFSYKKNFLKIIIVFIISIFLGGILLDKLKLNEYLQKGRMRRFYQNIQTGSERGQFVKGVYKYNKGL